MWLDVPLHMRRKTERQLVAGARSKHELAVDTLHVWKHLPPSSTSAHHNLGPGDKSSLVVLCVQVLKQTGNLLLLDEPTNDLDVDTLRALETAIDSFAGSSMIISHDRWFLDRLATHILAFEGDSEVVWFEGSYSEYEADRRKRLGKVEPTRIKYRRLATA